ncbi:MAG: hypothetical protein ACM3QW_03850 [Ignavibacteriales bacterium]
MRKFELRTGDRVAGWYHWHLRSPNRYAERLNISGNEEKYRFSVKFSLTFSIYRYPQMFIQFSKYSAY